MDSWEILILALNFGKVLDSPFNSQEEINSLVREVLLAHGD